MKREAGIEEKQRQFWDGITKRRHPGDPVIAEFVRPKLEFAQAHMDLPSQPRVVDVGCGNGFFTVFLARSGTTLGLDLSLPMLRMNPHPQLSCGSALELPLADDSCDLAVCSNLLHHLPAPVRAVRELARVSRGYVLLSEPHRNNPAIFLLGLLRPEERMSLRFTRGYLRTLATRAGLSVVACAALGFVTPNRMPPWVVRLAARFKRPSPLAAYTVLVGVTAGRGR